MSDKSPPQQRWWNIEGWGLRRKVTAVLAVPVTVAMVLGGLRVENELSNAVHFSSAADQVAAVPDIVEFSTAFATATASAAAGTVTPEEMAALGDAFGTIASVTENPELDPAVTADLSRTAASAQSLYTKLQAGPVPVEEIGAVTNEVRDSLNRIVEAILDEVDDREILIYGDQLINAWYSQRYLFGQVLGVLQLLADPNQPGTALVSASGAELAMLDLLARSYPMADQQIAELRAGVQERADMVDAAGSGPLPILNIRASLLNSVDIYGTIIDEASAQVSTTIQDRAAETRSAALRDTAIVLAALLAALVLALLVSRSLVGPIRRLRYGTLKVARQELPEAIDRIKVGDSIEDIEFTRVPVHTTEEIGQLARAVDDMHGQALRLAGEQAHLRLQISDMFETLARRSKSLVEQQLGLIERLEYEEKDPTRLESLFRLDHLAARMRRNGDNLLILSGTRMRRGHSAPVQLGDILRAAMSEVEDYQRVQIGSTPDGALSGAVATDIVHLLAELVDNSLRASPPDSNVTFSFARAVDGGLLVEIADRGIGIPADELESINQRLSKGGEVGPDTARHMGLFVVSRLAERHGLTVRLRPTFDTARNPGITASVHIPDVLLVSPLALSHTGPQARIEIEAEEYSAAPALSAPVAQQGLPASDDQHEYATLQADSVDDVRADESEDAYADNGYANNGYADDVDENASAARDAEPSYEDERRDEPQREAGRNEFSQSTQSASSFQAPPPRDPQGPSPRDNQAPSPRDNQVPPASREFGPSGLPQRRPGGTPGLPTRQPGETPGLPTPPRSPQPRRIEPDAAAAFASSLPPRGPRRGPDETNGHSFDGRNGAGPRPDADQGRREGLSGLPQRRPGSTPGLPPTDSAPARDTRQDQPQGRDAQQGSAHRAPAPPQRPASPGLPQRRPGATPGLPGRATGSSPSVPRNRPQQPVAGPLAGGDSTDRPDAPNRPDLPQRAPAQDAQRAPAQDAQRAPAQDAQRAPAQDAQRAPAPDADRRQQESSSGLPQRRPGSTPGLPRRQPGSTPGLPQRPAAATNGSEPDSAATVSGPSIADGGSVSPHSDAQQAARHRYRTNSAKTASFFQPRSDLASARPQPANTPIFTTMMSDWLVDPTSLPEDRRKREWHSAADAGWEAAQRATEAPVEEHTTAGLPRRAPGERLVPGAVRAPATGELPRTIRRRDPEAIRANLSRHQQGVRNGRASANSSNRENDEQGVR
ncbi:signal transduction histidine kinase [Rhodococcus rhodochrous J45]|uniref:histidine kinase n=1 Tax=Rhodococcus rhodochrous J45 TaxID=935266 RepID=A0A562ES50_RHORH|nr:ATP-binding protein [Rhodococcus rhodochrous]TWH24685.1 signal transduction histidine kinase [Rhodococcus rhodochrous J45]